MTAQVGRPCSCVGCFRGEARSRDAQVQTDALSSLFSCLCGDCEEGIGSDGWNRTTDLGVMKD
jgi:hypothetical protein